jgi:hypothetical protein
LKQGIDKERLTHSKCGIMISKMFLGQIGLLVIMHFDNSQVSFSEKEIQQYKSKLINKCFAILGIYEDCDKNKSYTPYLTYIDRVKIEFVGFSTNTNNIHLVSIVNILTGMQDVERLCHKDVKSLVFHIISIVQKMEV